LRIWEKKHRATGRSVGLGRAVPWSMAAPARELVADQLKRDHQWLEFHNRRVASSSPSRTRETAGADPGFASPGGLHALSGRPQSLIGRIAELYRRLFTRNGRLSATNVRCGFIDERSARRDAGG
jgi:hypothetical protein